MHLTNLLNRDRLPSKTDNDRWSGPLGPDLWYQVERQDNADSKGDEPEYPEDGEIMQVL